jgi:hypothetical protein
VHSRSIQGVDNAAGLGKGVAVTGVRTDGHVDRPLATTAHPNRVLRALDPSDPDRLDHLARENRRSHAGTVQLELRPTLGRTQGSGLNLVEELLLRGTATHDHEEEPG